MRDGSDGPRDPHAARNLAFVVHLTDIVSDSDEQTGGRVEHVSTGRATFFATPLELVTFMRQTLADLWTDDS